MKLYTTSDDDDDDGVKLPSYGFLRDYTPSYPDQIIEDAGIGFVVGSVYGLYKSFSNLPKHSLFTRLRGGLQASRVNAPLLGGKFAVFFTISSSLGRTMAQNRHKEDPWNEIMAVTATTALFNSHRGFRTASRAAIKWGSVFAFAYGSIFMLERAFLRDDSYNHKIRDILVSDYVHVPVPPSVEPEPELDDVAPGGEPMIPNQYIITDLKQQLNGESFGGRISFGGLFSDQRIGGGGRSNSTLFGY